jgi:hypothetical protein
MSKIVCTIWVCRNCILVHANGECGEIHANMCDLLVFDQEPGTLVSGIPVTCTCGAKEPLSEIPEGHSVTAGMSPEDHTEDCPNRTEGSETVECECGVNPFSTYPCHACGSSLHGEREMMTLWDDRPEEKWEVLEFCSAPEFKPRGGVVAIYVHGSEIEAVADRDKRRRIDVQRIESGEPDYWARTFVVRRHKP